MESALGSVLIGDGADGFSSDLFDFLTPPTRSLASRDHDSKRLCASQQAAGPKPLMVREFVRFDYQFSIHLKYR